MSWSRPGNGDGLGRRRATIFLLLTAILFMVLGAVLEGLLAVVILLPTLLPS